MTLDQLQYCCEVLSMFDIAALDDYIDKFWSILSGKGGE